MSLEQEEMYLNAETKMNFGTYEGEMNRGSCVQKKVRTPQRKGLLNYS
jgi:hypothetical protein